MAWHERLQTGIELGYDGAGRASVGRTRGPSTVCVPGRDLAISTGQPTFSRLLNIGNSANRKEPQRAPETAPVAFLVYGPPAPHRTLPWPLYGPPVVHRVATNLTILEMPPRLSKTSCAPSSFLTRNFSLKHHETGCLATGKYPLYLR